MPKTMSDPIWNHWTVTVASDDGKKERVECKYCKSHEQLRNAPKCKKHTINCNKAPTSVRRRFEQDINAKQMNRLLKSDLSFRAHTSQLLGIQHVEDDNESTLVVRESEPIEQQVRINPLVFESEVPNIKHHSVVRRRTKLSNDSMNANAIVKYIDTFHRVKEDMNYLLTETTTERKREFLSFALEVIAENMSEEDKVHLQNEIRSISGLYL